MTPEINTHNLVLTFGKHKGEMLMDVTPSYLRWVLHWINDDPDRAASPMLGDTAYAIEQFFQQG